MPSIEIRQLEYFVAVHEHGGVTRAAEALHLSQPSLSQAIRSLERSLKVELFHRVGRGLVLAPAGEVLMEPAREVLRSLARAQQAVQDLRRLEHGRLNVATVAALVSDPLAAWIGKFRREFPRVSVRLEESDDGAGVAELVRSGDCDLGITSSPELAGGLEGTVLSDQHVVLASPPGTARADGPVALADLGDEPLIVDGHRGAAWIEIERALRDCGVEPRIAVQVHRTASTASLVLSGAGSAFLPLRLALVAHERGAVIRETSPSLVRTLRVLHRPGPLPSAAQAFHELITHDARRWVSALDRRRAEGDALVAAGLAVDHQIRSARVAAGLGT